MALNSGNKKEQHVVFHLTGNRFAYLILSFPTFAFISCVFLSLVNNFESSTATHCKVKNYLPSISAAIGGFTPQLYIWRICIALHSTPRFAIAIMFYNFFASFQVTSRRGLYIFLAKLASLLHILEVLALVTLSYISSTENHDLHENSFIAFIVFSQVYMLLTCILYKWSHHGKTMTQTEKKSFRYKVFLFVFNVTSFLTAVYFFFRHNSYCEPGVYSFFALFEYLIVASNIGFHATGYVLDFGDADIIVLSKLRPAQYAQYRILPT